MGWTGCVESYLSIHAVGRCAAEENGGLCRSICGTEKKEGLKQFNALRRYCIVLYFLLDTYNIDSKSGEGWGGIVILLDDSLGPCPWLTWCYPVVILSILPIKRDSISPPRRATRPAFASQCCPCPDLSSPLLFVATNNHPILSPFHPQRLLLKPQENWSESSF